MTSSPPAEAQEIRGKTLTPVSPKPLHFPAPSNIPILEKQMDPDFHNATAHIGMTNGDSQTQYAQPIHETNPPHHQYEQSGTSAMGNGQQHGQDEAGAGADVAMSGANPQGTSTIHTFDLSNIQNGASYADAEPQPTPLPTSNPTIAHNPALSLAAQTAAQENGAEAHQSAGGVNFQALLDQLSPNTATAPQAEGMTAPTTASPSANSHLPLQGALQSAEMSSLAGPAGLPPRPPPQEKPASHPNYAPGDDIRSYHPHNQPPPAAYRLPPGLPPPPLSVGAPGVVGANGLPPPPVATFQKPPMQQMSPLSPSFSQRDSVDRRASKPANVYEDEDVPWGPEIQRIYDDFLQQERQYVTEGQWDRFPPNSRLFIGNLPTEKVTKRDLFHIFHKHGQLAQISIKQAYGFIQFLDSGACYRALQVEQGMTVRGRKMHLEISKPQKNTPKGGNQQQRGRSPDYNRGGTGGHQNNMRRDAGRDGGTDSYRDRPRMRDDYRPGRSPSPSRGQRRGRDEYRGGRDRSRSRDRYRKRSRSRSPYGRGQRYRSPSPRRSVDDELPLPRREARDVPDVQMIVLDDLDRNFISYVERAFVSSGLRADVLMLSPRLSEDAVIRRQILEGVQAVVRLTRMHQQTGKIPLKIFDRRQGANNVNFEDYENLDPPIAAQLVIRAKSTLAAPPASYGLPPTPTYPTPQYGLPPQYAPQAPPQQPPQPQAAPPQNLANMITSLDGAGLQKLLGAMQGNPQAAPQTHPQQPPSSLTPDLARLFASAGGQPGYPQQAAPTAPPQANPYGSLANNPAFASLLGGSVPQPTPQAAPTPQQNGGQPDVQDIMAQLAKYRR